MPTSQGTRAAKELWTRAGTPLTGSKGRQIHTHYEKFRIGKYPSGIVLYSIMHNVPATLHVAHTGEIFYYRKLSCLH